MRSNKKMFQIMKILDYWPIFKYLYQCKTRNKTNQRLPYDKNVVK
jgi:hypothetical protein